MAQVLPLARSAGPRRFAGPVLAAMLAAGGAGAQGLPVARLTCTADLGQFRAEGVVDVGLFQSGTMVDRGNTAERQQIRILILEGRAREIPGVLNLVGLFNVGGNRMDFDVTLTGGTTGTGQYWMNGASHRGTIFDLALVAGGFVVRDENGLMATYRCR